MSERFAVILESGTMDKLMAASILTAGAVAMGEGITVFLPSVVGRDVRGLRGTARATCRIRRSNRVDGG
jgi:hypothetical protein